MAGVGQANEGDASGDIRRQIGPHVFVEDLAAPVLDERDHHHLTKSLRLRSGDALTASDGAGSWAPMTLGDNRRLESTGGVVAVEPPPWSVTLAVALTKGAKPEFAVQKATELGVDAVVIFEADHSVPTWEAAKRDRSLDRLARVSREAAMQSRQVRIPSVSFADSFDALITLTGGQHSQLARADFGGAPVQSSDRAIAIGPEGGWSARERERLPAHVDLGDTVLRAETAAVVAGAEMMRLRRLGR